MKYELAIRKAAEDDLAQVRDWYDAQRPGLGSEFLIEVDAACARMVESPLAYPTMHRDVRRVLVRRFPYKLWFRIVNDTVVVLACTHAARGPTYTNRRLT